MPERRLPATPTPRPECDPPAAVPTTAAPTESVRPGRGVEAAAASGPVAREEVVEA